MLKKIQFQPADILYILGDAIDRGPHGAALLLDLMKRPNVIHILGNHELMAAVCLPWLLQEVTQQNIAYLSEEKVAALSEWIANGGEPTLRELGRLRRDEREQILNYIREMDLYAEVKVDNRIFVLTHAGLSHFLPERALADYELLDFLLCRPEPDTVFYPDKILIFGHTPTRLLSGQDKIFRRGTMIDVDCGCGFDGRLGCLCLETMEEFYV